MANQFCERYKTLGVRNLLNIIDNPGNDQPVAVEAAENELMARCLSLHWRSDTGIAAGSVSGIAAETAGIILVNSNPKGIVGLISFGKAMYKKMVQNLVWATAYNAVALTAGVLYKQGIPQR